MEELNSYIEQLITTFGEQPDELRTAVGGMDKEELHKPIEPGGWTPHQVAMHVVAADENALLPRLRRILQEENPDLPNWEEERWMEEEYDPTVPIDEAIDGWKSERAALAGTLLTDDLTVWNRTCTHPTQRERTLLWWLEYAVGHLRDHMRQLQAA